MAKKRTQKDISEPPKGQSGATGGPATSRGLEYQLHYAVYQTLALISQQLAAPYLDLSITMEPRQVHEQNITRSDVRIASAETSTELKLRPTRADILEWIGRVAADPSGERHELVYGSASATLLATLIALLRLAAEASGDLRQLQNLALIENLKDHDSLLLPFGPNAATRLLALSVKQLPEPIVEENIVVRASVLAPEKHELLVTLLKEDFLQGMKARRTFSIRSIIDRLHTHGVTLQTPTELALSDLSPPTRAVLAALQHCPSGLPNEVISVISNCSPQETVSVLQPVIDKRVLNFDGQRWRLLIPFPNLNQELLGTLDRSLSALVDFINRNEETSTGRALLSDAVALTRVCHAHAPKSVIFVFRKLEKLLKRLGDKYLVLQLAELTIAGASQLPRSLEDARAHAHALICGMSWVYQRIGDLDEARRLARKSLELGADINWERNTAFCLKCDGRIMRMQAEKENDGATSELLDASARSINNAIDHFTGMAEIGPTHEEVGDCFSLLARTFLVARRYDDARAALRRAYELIPQTGSKEHLDLLILSGDLEAAVGNSDAAESTYTEALRLPEAADVQKSEMFARGFYQRARLRENGRRLAQAAEDYERAANLWFDLHEYENGARARWRTICLRFPQERTLLDQIAVEESFLVRVTAYNLYLHRDHSPESIARRKQPTTQQIIQLLKEARQNVAVEYPHR